LKLKKNEYNELNKVLVDRFELEKINAVVVDHEGRKKNAHLRSQYWAKKRGDGVGQEQVYDALIESGLEDLAVRGYNPQSLSSFLREKYAENSEYEIPAALASLVDFKKVTQIAITGR